MQINLSPAETYKQNIKKYSGLLIGHKKTRSGLGWLRLSSIVTTFIAAYYGFTDRWLTGWIVVAAGIAWFLWLVSKDLKNNERIYHCETLLYLNEEELSILNGDYLRREAGVNFSPVDHPYAADLDLFGESSIYQYINRCTSEQGKSNLASALLIPSPAKSILLRQKAAAELKDQLNWRQQFQFLSIAYPITFSTQRKIANWLNASAPYTQDFWKKVVIVFPVITLACLAAFIFEWISIPVFILLVLLFFIVSLLISGKISSSYALLSKVVNEVQTLYRQLQHFEELKCNSELLTTLQQNLHANGNASANILKLKRILDRFDYRLNILVFFILNTFLLWDLRQMLSLNKWKEKNAPHVENWFNAISTLELIITLSTLAYNHPGWTFPVPVKDYFTLKATETGHPLIAPGHRVNNSFEVTGTGKVSIVTGSNMGGKSTFLRNLGVNLVLAQMGAAVCAGSFVFSPVKLYTSMRISDNLAENTSTFYAELKKLKTIIGQVNQRKKVFILLDEILRGTNSLDKHKGSEALIKQLISRHAVAVIATHDVELGNLKKEYGEHIENYYFDVQVAGEELYFDYKIKRGICQSMNASLLMKKIGINVEP